MCDIFFSSIVIFILTAQGAKLIDCGIAVLIEEVHDPSKKNFTMINTRSGGPSGTLSYMCPNYIRTQKYGEAVCLSYYYVFCICRINNVLYC